MQIIRQRGTTQSVWLPPQRSVISQNQSRVSFQQAVNCHSSLLQAGTKLQCQGQIISNQLPCQNQIPFQPQIPFQSQAQQTFFQKPTLQFVPQQQPFAQTFPSSLQPIRSVSQPSIVKIAPPSNAIQQPIRISRINPQTNSQTTAVSNSMVINHSQSQSPFQTTRFFAKNLISNSSQPQSLQVSQSSTSTPQFVQMRQPHVIIKNSNCSQSILLPPPSQVSNNSSVVFQDTKMNAPRFVPAQKGVIRSSSCSPVITMVSTISSNSTFVIPTQVPSKPISNLTSTVQVPVLPLTILAPSHQIPTFHKSQSSINISAPSVQNNTNCEKMSSISSSSMIIAQKNPCYQTILAPTSIPQNTIATLNFTQTPTNNTTRLNSFQIVSTLEKNKRSFTVGFNPLNQSLPSIVPLQIKPTDSSKSFTSLFKHKSVTIHLDKNISKNIHQIIPNVIIREIKPNTSGILAERAFNPTNFLKQQVTFIQFDQNQRINPQLPLSPPPPITIRTCFDQLSNISVQRSLPSFISTKTPNGTTQAQILFYPQNIYQPIFQPKQIDLYPNIETNNSTKQNQLMIESSAPQSYQHNLISPISFNIKESPQSGFQVQESNLGETEKERLEYQKNVQKQCRLIMENIEKEFSIQNNKSSSLSSSPLIPSNYKSEDLNQASQEFQEFQEIQVSDFRTPFERNHLISKSFKNGIELNSVKEISFRTIDQDEIVKNKEDYFDEQNEEYNYLGKNQASERSTNSIGNSIQNSQTSKVTFDLSKNDYITQQQIQEIKQGESTQVVLLNENELNTSKKDDFIEELEERQIRSDYQEDNLLVNEQKSENGTLDTFIAQNSEQQNFLQEDHQLLQEEISQVKEKHEEYEEDTQTFNNETKEETIKDKQDSAVDISIKQNVSNDLNDSCARFISSEVRTMFDNVQTCAGLPLSQDEPSNQSICSKEAAPIESLDNKQENDIIEHIVNISNQPKIITFSATNEVSINSLNKQEQEIIPIQLQYSQAKQSKINKSDSYFSPQKLDTVESLDDIDHHEKEEFTESKQDLNIEILEKEAELIEQSMSPELYFSPKDYTNISMQVKENKLRQLHQNIQENVKKTLSSLNEAEIKTISMKIYENVFTLLREKYNIEVSQTSRFVEGSSEILSQTAFSFPASQRTKPFSLSLHKRSSSQKGNSFQTDSPQTRRDASKNEGSQTPNNKEIDLNKLKAESPKRIVNEFNNFKKIASETSLSPNIQKSQFASFDGSMSSDVQLQLMMSNLQKVQSSLSPVRELENTFEPGQGQFNNINDKDSVGASTNRSLQSHIQRIDKAFYSPVKQSSKEPCSFTDQIIQSEQEYLDSEEDNNFFFPQNRITRQQQPSRSNRNKEISPHTSDKAIQAVLQNVPPLKLRGMSLHSFVSNDLGFSGFSSRNRFTPTSVKSACNTSQRMNVLSFKQSSSVKKPQTERIEKVVKASLINPNNISKQNSDNFVQKYLKKCQGTQKRQEGEKQMQRIKSTLIANCKNPLAILTDRKSQQSFSGKKSKSQSFYQPSSLASIQKMLIS